MCITNIKLKPLTNSLRHQSKLQKYLLCKSNSLIKSLVKGFKRYYGRSSNTGRITVRHKGGNNFPCKYRILNKLNNYFYAIVIGLVYDPRRNAFLSLNFNILTKSFFYTPAINHLNPGALLICKNKSNEFRLGYRMAINNLPIGTIINNISSSNHFYFCLAYIFNTTKCEQPYKSS